MKLIKEIESKRAKNGHLVKCGIFYCDFCNREKEMILSNGLKAKSCGCNRNYKHGGSFNKERLYGIWRSMKKRCLIPNHKNFKYYGDRGITICPEWTNCYAKFRDWSLNNGYADNLEIDRKDTNGNYEQNNCRWVTHGENVKNQRNIKLNKTIVQEIRTLYKTGNYPQKELAIKYNVKPNTISQIISNKRWIIS